MIYLPFVSNLQEADMPTYLEYTIYYLTLVFIDGDYANDWLTHMPDDVATLMYQAGQLIALALGW